MEALLQYPTEAEYLRGLGLLGAADRDAAIASFDECRQLVNNKAYVKAFDVCEAWVDGERAVYEPCPWISGWMEGWMEGRKDGRSDG